MGTRVPPRVPPVESLAPQRPHKPMHVRILHNTVAQCLIKTIENGANQQTKQTSESQKTKFYMRPIL